MIYLKTVYGNEKVLSIPGFDLINFEYTYRCHKSVYLKD